MINSLRKAIRKYNAADKNEYMSQQDRDKIKGMAKNEAILGVVETLNNSPLMIAATATAGVSFATGNGAVAFMATGFMVVAKAMSALAQSSEFVMAHNNRNFFEEKLALELSNDPKNDYLINKTNILTSSMEMLIGYNNAYNMAKKEGGYEGFLRCGKKYVMDAFKFAEDKFLGMLETKEESSWLKRFLTKPVDKLIPKNIKIYFENTRQKRNLLNWVEKKYKNFEEGKYFKEISKGQEEVFEPYNKMSEDILRTFKEGYEDVLSSSIKVKYVELVNDYFSLTSRVKNKKVFNSLFEENLKDKFEKLSQLYKETKDPKYFVLSSVASSILKNVEAGEYKKIKGWSVKHSPEMNEKIINKFTDMMAEKYGKTKIINISKVNNPLITIFNKKLDAIMRQRIDENLTKKESKALVESAAYEKVEFTKEELASYRKTVVLQNEAKEHEKSYSKLARKYS